MTKPKQTKKAKVRAMLERPDGATLDAICKAGHTVKRSTPGDGKAGAARYRITASPAAVE